MKDLLQKKNVVYACIGTKKIAGLDTGRLAVEVHVTKKEPVNILPAKDRIPLTYKGIETDVVGDTDEIRALRKHRPMLGGVSIGHPEVTAGTGTPIKFPGHDDMLIYSNNHVIANCNDCQVGDQIWQPGRADGGSSTDTIGHLWRWVELVFTDSKSLCPIARAYAWIGNTASQMLGRNSRICALGNRVNRVDAAVSKPLGQDDLSPEIMGIGVPKGFNSSVEEGEKVIKSGRTTAVTDGEVVAIGAVCNVNYGGKVGMFENQILTTKMSEGGDSGSIVLNQHREIVGALFAGSSQVTISNTIDDIIEELGLW